MVRKPKQEEKLGVTIWEKHFSPFRCGNRLTGWVSLVCLLPDSRSRFPPPTLNCLRKVRVRFPGSGRKNRKGGTSTRDCVYEHKENWASFPGRKEGGV